MGLTRSFILFGVEVWVRLGHYDNNETDTQSTSWYSIKCVGRYDKYSGLCPCSIYYLSIQLDFIIDMFKKRTIKKQTNIEDLLTDITTNQIVAQEQENSKEIDRPVIQSGLNTKMMPRNGNANKNINKMVEEYHEVDEDRINIQVEQDKQKMEMSKSQIQQCIAQFLEVQRQAEQHNQPQPTQHERRYNYYQQQQDQALKNNPTQNQHNTINLEQEYEQIHQQEQESRKLRVIHEVIIEDESGEQVEVREDYGEVSDLSDSEDYEEGYENQIIRKTLSKYNYDKVSQNLFQANTKNKQNKLLKQLSKVSYSGIQRKIAKDLRIKRQKKQEVLAQVKYIDAKIKHRQAEIAEKMRNRQKIAGDLDRIKRILQLLYYYGSQIQVQWVDETRLNQMVYQQEWKQKIDKIRHNIRKNKQQFEAKKKKTQYQQQSQKQKSGSQGDVEQIGKYRLGEGWNGWQAEDDEVNQNNHRNARQNNDDDECMLIDD